MVAGGLIKKKITVITVIMTTATAQSSNCVWDRCVCVVSPRFLKAALQVVDSYLSHFRDEETEALQR